MALLEVVILRGTRAAQPLATAVSTGSLYSVTDESNIIEQSTGAAWVAYSPTSGAGSVTNTGALTANALIMGNGGVDVSTTATAAGILTFLGTPSSANLAAALTDETGTGAAVFANSPTLVTPALGTPSAIVLTNATSLPATALPTATRTRAITCVIDGGGSAITTGIKADVSVPYACTITGVRMLADQSGSIVVDIWKDTYANYPPTDADSITAAAVPTITTATKSEDTTLTGWTTSITAGDTLRFNVDSITTVTRLALTLTVTV